MSTELLPKRLELLAEVAPKAILVAFLLNPTSPTSEPRVKDVEAAGRALGRQVTVFRARNDLEIESAFAAIKQTSAGALLIGNDTFFNTRSAQLGSLALRHAIPAIYQNREFVAAGGLLSYGASLTDAYRIVGAYTGRILKGEKPADLPVQQQTKVDFFVNLKTARLLGLTVPLPVVALADEVIE